MEDSTSLLGLYENRSPIAIRDQSPSQGRSYQETPTARADATEAPTPATGPVPAAPAEPGTGRTALRGQSETTEALAGMRTGRGALGLMVEDSTRLSRLLILNFVIHLPFYNFIHPTILSSFITEDSKKLEATSSNLS